MHAILAQVTNTASGVASIVNTGVAPAFDACIALAVSVAAVLVAIRYVKKGLGGR